MAWDNSEHHSMQHLTSMTTRLAPGRLALELVNHQASTKRARIRDRTMVDLAVALRGTRRRHHGLENDGSTCKMTFPPRRIGQNGQGTTA